MKRKTKAERASAPAPAESAMAMGVALTIEEPLTPGNLQSAYTVESSAHDRYLAFAAEAEEEGYEPVASLFRAAARGEEIHARNHREAMNGSGASAKPGNETPVVQSTRESLQGAIESEVHERDEMYPSFVHQARSEGNRQAARSFQLAQKVETQHAALFTQSLQDLERLRGEAVVYFVCPVCGFASAKEDMLRCPVCSTPADRFEKVS